MDLGQQEYKPIDSDENLVYTVSDLQRVYKIGRTEAYKLVKSGQFPVKVVGKNSYRIPVKTFKEWLYSSD